MQQNTFRNCHPHIHANDFPLKLTISSKLYQFLTLQLQQYVRDGNPYECQFHDRMKSTR